jgi:hypothetical protein
MGRGSLKPPPTPHKLMYGYSTEISVDLSQHGLNMFQQRHLYRRDHEAKQKLLLNARGKKAYHILSTIEAKSREKALSK